MSRNGRCRHHIEKLGEILIHDDFELIWEEE